MFSGSEVAILGGSGSGVMSGSLGWISMRGGRGAHWSKVGPGRLVAWVGAPFRAGEDEARGVVGRGGSMKSGAMVGVSPALMRDVAAGGLRSRCGSGKGWGGGGWRTAG